tara:strand:- start:45207 stop:45602 length:396 start_codon:yes stop_codon:yes gene_type:complete
MRIVLNIDVPALDPAIAFYTTAFGLTLSRIIDEDVAELKGASYVIYLLAKAAESTVGTGAKETRRYTRHWTPIHPDFVVKDIAAFATQVMNAGAIQESECIDWKGSKCLTFSDPFGHGFCLIEFKNETYED